jgi:hypothetical protein
MFFSLMHADMNYNVQRDDTIIHTDILKETIGLFPEFSNVLNQEA